MEYVTISDGFSHGKNSHKGALGRSDSARLGDPQDPASGDGSVVSPSENPAMKPLKFSWCFWTFLP